ncbi:MAG: ArsR/SmtB family transcription factor, partial [Nitratireductor sp.]
LLLKAMGHPSRVSLIEHLSKNEQCCGADFCGCMGLAQSTISQHLDLLKEAGLVEVKACGTKSMFKLNREKLNALGQSLQAISNCKCDC